MIPEAHVTAWAALLGNRPVNRALCRVGPGGKLAGIAEGEVRRRGVTHPDDAALLQETLTGPAW